MFIKHSNHYICTQVKLRIVTDISLKCLLYFFQEKDEHLELLEGMLIDLLKTKWNTFVKFRFYRQFILFSFYFLVSLVCFTLRPGPPDRPPNNSTLLNTTIATPLNFTEGITDNVGKTCIYPFSYHIFIIDCLECF